MQLQSAVQCPLSERLTGTAGEPALHFHSDDILVQIKPDNASISGGSVALFITSQDVMLFVKRTDTLVTLQYPEIILHAVGSDPRSLYLQIESPEIELLGQELPGGMVELWLVPNEEETSMVDDMFAALSRCASMHPDPMEQDAEGGDSIQAMLDDPNHQWITADSVEGRFDNVDSEDNGDLSNGQDGPDGPRKYRRTG